MAEEQPPTLKLVIEKGPRAGETLEFLSTQPPIRIGRVVRGNSVPIKDPGISTKHLSIHFQSNQWLITDNNSSNGTVLNSSTLPPLSPLALHDGDVFKIGEVTVIKVRVLGEEEKQPRGRTRREKAVVVGSGENVGGSELGFGGDLGKEGKKPRGRSKREKVVKVEDRELGFSEVLGKKEKPPTRRTRRDKAAEVESGLNVEDTELGFGEDLRENAVGEGKRSTRGRAKREKVESSSNNVGRQVSPRRTRGLLKNEISRSTVEQVSGRDEVGVAAQVFEKKTRGRQGKKRKEKALKGEDSGKETEELGAVKIEILPQVSTRRTRSKRVVEDAEKEGVDAQVIKTADKAKKLNPNNNNNNIHREKLGSLRGNISDKGKLINVQSGDELNSEKVVVKSEPHESSFFGVENVGNLQNLGTAEEEREKERDCNESVKKSGFKDGEAPDPAKMTLGDYFDYLEVYLPSVIYKETEQIISEMHHKAEKFRELVHEHGKDKSKCM